MAAHGLTICKQLLTVTGDARLLKIAEHALNAPGWDVGPSDPGCDGYHDVYEGVRTSDVERVRNGILAIAERLAFLDRYPCLEDARAQYDRFVRVGARGWQRRHAKWFANDPKAHTRKAA